MDFHLQWVITVQEVWWLHYYKLIFYIYFSTLADDNFPSGNDVSIDVDISSNTSFTFSWNVPNGGVDLINLEYICYTEDETPPNVSTLSTSYTTTNSHYFQESDVVLSFSERKHGSEFIEVADLESPIECIVFGCYSDDYIFDMFKIESKTFILEVEPVVLPSPSPSPFPSPPPACECDIQSQRLRRDTPHEESASVNHITGMKFNMIMLT